MLAPTMMILLAAATTAAAGEERAATPYKDDPTIHAKVRSLGDRTGLMLGKFKVMPVDAGRLPSGVYFLKLEDGHSASSKKVVLLK